MESINLEPTHPPTTHTYHSGIMWHGVLHGVTRLFKVHLSLFPRGDVSLKPCLPPAPLGVGHRYYTRKVRTSELNTHQKSYTEQFMCVSMENSRKWIKCSPGTVFCTIIIMYIVELTFHISRQYFTEGECAFSFLCRHLIKGKFRKLIVTNNLHTPLYSALVLSDPLRLKTSLSWHRYRLCTSL